MLVAYSSIQNKKMGLAEQQVVVYLLSKYKTVSSNSNTANKKI
jgi:hypothetical protein